MDMSEFISIVTQSLTDFVSKAAIACAGVVGIGLTIFGIKWVVKTIKNFFVLIGEDERNDFTPDGWTDEDERAYRDMSLDFIDD